MFAKIIYFMKIHLFVDINIHHFIDANTVAEIVAVAANRLVGLEPAAHHLVADKPLHQTAFLLNKTSTNLFKEKL